MIELSVIIATYNRVRLLPRLLDSWRRVMNSTPHSFELIFSDDGSGDETAAVLEAIRDLPITLLRNSHEGVSHARNKAIAHARGRLLLFSGDDIFPEPDCLDRHIDASLRAGPNTAILGRIEWHPELGKSHLMKHITEIGCEQFAFPRLTPREPVNFQHFYTSNISIEREFLLSCGGLFSHQFHKLNYEDIELGYRLSKKGLKIVYHPDALAYHYHPYSVPAFCMRQANAGEMANVLEKLHPELEGLLEIMQIRRRFDRFAGRAGNRTLLHPKNNSYRLAEIAALCERVERHPQGKDRDILLSSVYFALFRAYYELGVLKGMGLEEPGLLEDFLRFSYFPWSFVWDYRTPRIKIYDLKAVSRNFSTITDFTPLTEATGEVALAGGALTDCLRPAPCGRQERDEGIAARGMVRLLCYGRGCSRAMRGLVKQKRMGIKRRLTSLTHRHARPVCLAIRLPEMPLPKEIDRFLALFGINHRFIIGDTRYRARRDGILEKESQPPEETGRIYMYAPRSWGTMLERWQLQAVLLSLYMGSPGFLLVSRSLEAYPAVGLRDIGDQIFFSSSLGSSLEEFLQRRAGGRLMRLPPAPPDGRLINFETDSFMKGKIKTTPVRPMAVLSSGKAAGGGAGFMPPFRKKKKLIFVLPTFLAVGGVERNTIEVITQSRDSYDFVIINFEPLNPSLGSLHHQFGPEVEGIYDLPEITGRGEFIPALRNLRAVYDPDLVWICNGSPWLHRNLTKVRSLFEDIPIVDQQVYDTGEGWINIFHERGIHSFDRFIAINSKIRDAFVDVYHIEKEKIDLIYHAIDLKRIEEATEKREEARSISEKHRLPPDKKLFLFIGRMTPQKRPLDFLQFAEGEQALGNEGDHFVMIGDGELSGTVKDFIRERVLSNVTYIPFIENPMEIMAVAGGLIILSQYEGLPIAMLEALAMGLPVLSTDVGDVRLVLEEYNSGMVIDKTGDIEEIQHRFKAWKRDLEFFSERAREGAKHVRERFSGRSVAMHYGDTWKRAMEQKGRAVQ